MEMRSNKTQGPLDQSVPGARQRTPFVAVVTSVCVLAGALWHAEAAVAQGAEPQLARDYFLNVPDMGDLPVDEFMETMGMFASALGLNCADCHTFESSSSWAAYADETPIKQTARRMIRMLRTINDQQFGGQQFISCWTCHRGDLRPDVVPDLRVQYSAPDEDPNDPLFVPDPDAPPAAEIFDEYVQAIGGAQALGGLRTFEASATYNGFDTGFEDADAEIYATNPDRLTMIVHARPGDSVRVYNGANAWIAATDRAMPLLPLTGDTLGGARLEAVRLFPLGLQDERNFWQLGYTILNDEDVRVLRGISPGQPPVNLYFDDDGLLVRMLRFVDTPVGRVPTQIDFSDYREVAGVLMPFAWTSTWTDGQASVQITEVRPNVPVDPSRFDTPQPSAPARANTN